MVRLCALVHDTHFNIHPERRAALSSSVGPELHYPQLREGRKGITRPTVVDIFRPAGATH